LGATIQLDPKILHVGGTLDSIILDAIVGTFVHQINPPALKRDGLAVIGDIIIQYNIVRAIGGKKYAFLPVVRDIIRQKGIIVAIQVYIYAIIDI
jgi:hypothetical protein